MEGSKAQISTPHVRGKSRDLKKTVVVSLLGVLIVLNILLLAAGNYFYNIVITYNKLPKYLVNTYEQAVANGDFDVGRFNLLQKEYVNLESPHGYSLKGIYVKNALETPHTVIIVHGIGQDKWVSMKYADIFLDEGFNIFVFDNRNHGESGGERPSYGYYEKDDLQTCVAYIKSINPAGIIGIHSESLGAATAMLHAEIYNQNNTVAFYIEDCGYSDLRQLYIARAGDYGIPDFLRPILVDYMSLICKIRSGFFLGQISPIQSIDNVETPILFVHGEKDDFVPPQMAYDLFQAKSGHKALYIAAGAGHAKSITVDEVKYREAIGRFLDDVEDAIGSYDQRL